MTQLLVSATIEATKIAFVCRRHIINVDKRIIRSNVSYCHFMIANLTKLDLKWKFLKHFKMYLRLFKF